MGEIVEDMNSKYVESIARTNKLYCSDCNKKINKGDKVVFELDAENFKMLNVFGSKCKCNLIYETNVLEDNEHIFSSEATGQF